MKIFIEINNKTTELKNFFNSYNFLKFNFSKTECIILHNKYYYPLTLNTLK